MITKITITVTGPLELPVIEGTTMETIDNGGAIVISSETVDLMDVSINLGQKYEIKAE